MKKFLSLILITLFLFPSVILADEEKIENEMNKSNEIVLGKNAKSAVLIEASTGEILYQNNQDERLEPASMTKMMSMLLILESIDKGIIKWDDIVTVSENASSMGGSQILLETNEKMSVSDLFKGIAVASGNDAVVAMAEKIAGTEEGFVNMMNEKAKELGLKNTNFKNPHGLTAANHYSSAYDMAMIAKELVKYDKLFEYTSIYEDYLRKGTDKEIWLVNTNKLVRFYDGVDGLKTGYTKTAGYCLTATAKKNNMRVIAVVMGEPDSKTRNSEVSQMLDYAFAQYELETMLSTKSVVKKIKVDKSVSKYAEIVPKENVNFVNKKLQGKKNASYEVDLDNIKAPIKKGDKVGMLLIKEDNKVIRKVELTVNKDIKKANILELYWQNLQDILTGNITF